MKMTQEHFAFLQKAVQITDGKYPHLRASFEKGEVSAKRFRWTLLYLSVKTQWVCDMLYSYLDDTHIDTALRKITKTG